jgi:hypothetical protein
MQSTFTIVVFGAVGLSLVMSFIFLLGKGSVYDQIGEGGLNGESESSDGSAHASPEEPPEAAAQAAEARAWFAQAAGNSLIEAPEQAQTEREREIRQLVQARIERGVRRGEPALDIDAEVARLTAVDSSSAPQRDQELVQEVLQLVVARNERRERQGLEPLDIEAEVARTLAELEV